MSKHPLLKPKVVLGVAAHPDDLEFDAGGSLAAWSASGAKIYYLIITDGSKGTNDPKTTPAEITLIRREEQVTAAKILGVSEVFFLNYIDGNLENNQDLRRDIVKHIRHLKPDVVICLDPTMIYSQSLDMINHPDHRAAGQATLDAVYPLARDHLSFPELYFEENLKPHKVKTILLTNYEDHNYVVDISKTMDIKINALSAHASQMPNMTGVKKMINEYSSNVGKKNKMAYAEGFIRLDLSG